MKTDSLAPADARLHTVEEHAAVYAAVVASALDAVIVVDEHGKVVAMNPAAETTFGYSLDEALGKPIGSLIVPDHLKDAHEKGLARYRATRQPHVLGKRVEMQARCKDGSIIPIELAITEVNLPDRRLFTANLRDLSAAKASAAEIDRQRDALHQTEKLAALGSLLAGVAHELNNPLSIVLGQATLMRDDVSERHAPGYLRQRAEKIEAAAERCARVVRTFLAVARQRKAEKRAVAVDATLNGAIDLLQYNLRSGGVAVTRDYDGALPKIYVDPDQVQQIIVNLLVNAAQALEGTGGAREIRVSARRGDENVRIVVADNGPGVPKDIQARIFDPFFTTKPQGSGTGIGLSVSRGLAQTQGGRLTLQPSPLGGAAFELTLPLSTGVADAPESSGRSVAGDANGAGSADADRAQRRVIVVDDEVEIAVLIAEALRNADYTCDVATGGREALAKISARAGGYDALICDLRMPDIDGPALFDWIETHHPELAERTLFVTGDALGPGAGRFLAKSQRPVLEKPFAPADVVRLVSAFPPRARIA